MFEVFTIKKVINSRNDNRAEISGPGANFIVRPGPE